MNDIFARLGAVNPLVWIVLAITAALGFGARKWVSLMKIPEEKQLNFMIILKGAALLLAVLLFFLVIAK